MITTLRIGLGIALAVLATSAGAQSQLDDTPLDRLTRQEERSGWEAVGRVDIRGGGFCTGTLIEPDLVLTAAHCLMDAQSGRAIDPAGITFRAGYSDGTAVANRRALQTVVHPDYLDNESDHFNAIRTDIGLIKLSSAIPTVQASPFHIGEQKVGAEVSVVSYARGRSEALSWQRSCSVLDSSAQHGAAAFSCDVTYGSSGAPVFDTSRLRPMIVSLISRGGTRGNITISYGPIIQEPIVELKEALRASKGVNVAGGGLASVVQRSDGARFIKAGEGARFVKP